MYNYHLDQLNKIHQKENLEKSKSVVKQLKQHQQRTDQLKNRYWSRVENFMYNVNLKGDSKRKPLFNLSKLKIESISQI